MINNTGKRLKTPKLEDLTEGAEVYFPTGGNPRSLFGEATVMNATVARKRRTLQEFIRRGWVLIADEEN